MSAGQPLISGTHTFLLRGEEILPASGTSRAAFRVGHLDVGELSSLAFAFGQPPEMSLWGWFPSFRIGKRLSYVVAERSGIAFDQRFEWQFNAVIVTGTAQQIFLWPTSPIEIKRFEKRFGRPSIERNAEKNSGPVPCIPISGTGRRSR
jgi:hypothetical protein